MELTVIASSSEGNAYVIQNEGEALLIEAGANFSKTLEALGHNVAKVNGCLITHEHGDHAGHVNEVLSYGLPVYASRGTCNAIANKIRSAYKPRVLDFDSVGNYFDLQLGRFEVYPFAAKHDAAEPLGFYIWHPETGGILFATDTYYIRPTFADLRTVLIECNYAADILEANVEKSANGMTWQRAQRVRASHLSLDTCLAALKANDLSHVNNIVLIHVSAGNGDARRFKKAVEQATGKPTHIARPGLKIDLNINPF